MAANSLAPGFIRIFYTGVTGVHTMTLGYEPGTINPLHLKAGGITELVPATAITGLITVLRPAAPTTTSFDYWERWSISAPGADPIFQETAVIGLAGTNVAVAQPAHGMSFNYRTNLGGIGKLLLLDDVQAFQGRQRAPLYGATTIANIVAFMLGSTNWIRGRDNGYPVAVPAVTGKYYDALRKRFYLDA